MKNKINDKPKDFSNVNVKDGEQIVYHRMKKKFYVATIREEIGLVRCQLLEEEELFDMIKYRNSEPPFFESFIKDVLVVIWI